MYDVIIIGAGPAGMTAGLYAAKNKLKTLVLAKAVQKPLAEHVVMLLDFQQVFAEFEKALSKETDSLFLEEKQEVSNVEKNIVSFSVETKSGKTEYGRSVIIATGSVTVYDLNFDSITQKATNGTIKVDAGQQTNIPGLFAAGDVTYTQTKGTVHAILQGGLAALSAHQYLSSKSENG